jgi:hypothetical protein
MTGNKIASNEVAGSFRTGNEIAGDDVVGSFRTGLLGGRT